MTLAHWCSWGKLPFLGRSSGKHDCNGYPPTSQHPHHLRAVEARSAYHQVDGFELDRRSSVELRGQLDIISIFNDSKGYEFYPFDLHPRYIVDSSKTAC